MKFLAVQFANSVELDFTPVTIAKDADFTIALTKGGMLELKSKSSSRQYIIPLANVACLEFE